MFLHEKTTQAAAKFIKQSGGTMPYLALLKLLYLADKQMLLVWGTPLTYDQWFSMKHGPVLSNTYNLIKASPRTAAETGETTYWGQHICRNSYDVTLVSDPGDDLLSEAEDIIIAKVFSEYGSKDKWMLRDLTHELPEWNDPGNSSFPITYEQVLRAEGFPADAIEEIIENIHAEREIAQAFAQGS